MSEDEYYYRDQLYIQPEGNIGICTLWAPISQYTEYAYHKAVSIIGQLKTKQGIEYMLANIVRAGFETYYICKTKQVELNWQLMSISATK